MKIIARSIILGTVLASLIGCSAAQAQEAVVTAEAHAVAHPSFDSYWYQGLAELDHYRLEQSRYGEIHDGEAVLIFVTEDLHPELQVKTDRADVTERIPVLKLNAHRRFYTGIYPYSVLTSVFAPAHDAGADPLKISFSAQEWCGHTYTQLNNRGEHYEVTSHSYFESEADQTLTLPVATTEDELFTRVRRGPEALPTGELSIVPALAYLRLMHRPIAAVAATATLEDVASSPHGDAPARLYTIAYDDIGRTVRIYFEPQFPHRIVAWEEEQPALFGRGGAAPPNLTTRAVLTNSIMLDYWSRHDLDDAHWRDVLGLTM